jgi:RNA polymerase sigma-70 factor (ECF subfamily)
VVVLKEYQGLTFLEIAETLGVPPSTVKTRLYRGLGQLRQQLERQGIRGPAALPAPMP